MDVMTGDSCPACCFKNQVGIGLSEHDLDGDAAITCKSFSSFTASNISITGVALLVN